jgi:hypothetical protein
MSTVLARHRPAVNEGHPRICRSAAVSAPGQVAADDQALDLVGALEYLHGCGPAGSFRRSARWLGVWCQHGFSTGVPATAAPC